VSSDRETGRVILLKDATDGKSSTWKVMMLILRVILSNCEVTTVRFMFTKHEQM
jgi:hypothetical protein